MVKTLSFHMQPKNFFKVLILKRQSSLFKKKKSEGHPEDGLSTVEVCFSSGDFCAWGDPELFSAGSWGSDQAAVG